MNILGGVVKKANFRIPRAESVHGTDADVDGAVRSKEQRELDKPLHKGRKKRGTADREAGLDF